MAVQNSIANRPSLPENKQVEFQVNGATVRLTPNMVKNYLTNGDGRVTDQEVAMFINLCKYQGLNPLIRDAYLIKYGNQPATIVTSKDAIQKRAMRNPNYGGHQAGVIVLKETGELDYRTGAFTLPGETLIGGWARTYVKGYDVPIETAVSFEEYAGRKKNGELNSMWKGKPGVMIRKVALVASMREAFPEDLQGMYASEEVNAEDDTMAMPVEIPENPAQMPDPQAAMPEPQMEPMPAPDEVWMEQAEQVTMEGVDDVF